MVPEYAHIQKTKQIAHHDLLGSFLRAKCGHVSSSDSRSVRLTNGAFDRLRKGSVLRRAPQTLRIVPWPLWMPDDYLRSIEPLIAIVLGCMRWGRCGARWR
jgi:hypothetical protein